VSSCSRKVAAVTRPSVLLIAAQAGRGSSRWPLLPPLPRYEYRTVSPSTLMSPARRPMTSARLRPGEGEGQQDGTFTMPDSIASMRLKSDATHGRGCAMIASIGVLPPLGGSVVARSIFPVQRAPDSSLQQAVRARPSVESGLASFSFTPAALTAHRGAFPGDPDMRRRHAAGPCLLASSRRQPLDGRRSL
jgi:hypothetical protein